MNYTVKAAARATGVSESRLRTWERRYGIPRPARAPTGRRLYDEDDLTLIRRMASLVDAGMSAAQAAEAVLAGEPAPLEPPAAPHPLVATITDAAEAYDETAAMTAIRSAVRELDWPGALEQVIFPALKRVGLYWETAVIPPAGEHLVTELVRRELQAAINALPESSATAPRVMLACPEDEWHDVGLAALSLLLRKRGIRVTYLGANVPAPDLIDAYDATKPDAVCLSATSSIGLASMIRASRSLAAARRVRLYVGGPATALDGAEAAGIQLSGSVDAAAQTLAAAVRA
jgi:DNA-binding transcriptional MerR regulator/methylmalonyl-CoA mutase cobalamin-binding subunit